MFVRALPTDEVCSFIYLFSFLFSAPGKGPNISNSDSGGVVVTVSMPKWCRGGSIESIWEVIESNIYLRYSGGNSDPRYSGSSGVDVNYASAHVIRRTLRSAS